MRAFDYYKPASFEEAFKLLRLPDKRVYPLAGATDLIPHTRDEVWLPDVVVDIKELPGLRDLKMMDIEPCCGCVPEACLYIGAAVRMNEIVRSELVRSHWALLAQAASTVANEQVRNRATLGGNICTASPAADTAPALLALEAMVLIKGAGGERSVPIADFFVGPKRNVLQRDELVEAVLVPKPPDGSVGHYEKLSRRKAADLAIVGVAALAIPTGEAEKYRWRIALGAVAPTPIRCPDAELILEEGCDEAHIEKAAEAALACSSPISDIRASAAYRRAMVVNVTRRAIKRVLEKLSA